MARARHCPAHWPQARGVLADRDRQSEVRQYLIHAALKRADELNRLRDLPDTPAARRRGAAEGRRPAQRPDRRRSGRNHDDPRDAGRHHFPIEIGEPSSVELPAVAPQALPQSSSQEIVLCQESRAGQTAAGCAPSRLPRPPAHTGRGQADPVSPVQFLRDVFLGTAGSTIDVQRPAQSGSQTYSSRPSAQQYQQPAYGTQQQYYQWPVTNSGQTTQHNTLRARAQFPTRTSPAISSSWASYRNSRTNRSHRFACWPHADFAAN